MKARVFRTTLLITAGCFTFCFLTWDSAAECCNYSALPRFQRALFCYWSNLLLGNRQFASVNHFGFSIAVSEFQRAIPFSLCLAYNGISGIMFHFSCNPNSRRKKKSSNWYHSLSVYESITTALLLRLQACSYIYGTVFQA